MILQLLDLSSIPRAREGALEAPRRHSRLVDRFLNDRKPRFGRLLGLLGALLALFYLTLLYDAPSCVYFVCFVVALGGSFCTFLCQKSLISLERVTNFKVFAVFNWDVVFVLF